MSARPTPAPARLAPLDGLRGIAIVLVVLSHGWVLWPMDFIDGHSWIKPLFRGGNAGVTVFLVVSGFLSYRVLSSRGGLVTMQPLTAVVRRVIRVGPTLWTMLIVLMVVAALDSTDTATKHTNRESLARVVTYTYNWFVEGHFLDTRPDLGHLWYLSVDMQAFVLVALVAYVLRRRPVGFAVTMASLFVLAVWWRFHSYETESIWVALNRTTSRMDAFLLGVIAGAIAMRLPSAPGLYRALTTASLALMLPTLWWCDTDGSFLRWGGTALELLVAVFVVSSTRSEHQNWLLSRSVLVRLGQLSLLLYVWHLPIFHFVNRHTVDWGWAWSVVVALVALVVIAALSEVLVERRVSRILVHPNWALVRERGLTRYLLGAARERLPRPRRRLGGSAASPSERVDANG